MIDDRSTILKKKKNHCFFRKIKIQKIFFFNIKIFFILKFVKKICDFFSAKNFFCDILFWRKKFLAICKDPGHFSQHTHTIFKNFVFKNFQFRIPSE